MEVEIVELYAPPGEFAPVQIVVTCKTKAEARHMLKMAGQDTTVSQNIRTAIRINGHRETADYFQSAMHMDLCGKIFGSLKAMLKHRGDIAERYPEYDN